MIEAENKGSPSQESVFICDVVRRKGASAEPDREPIEAGNLNYR
jgi:hypothetical protein